MTYKRKVVILNGPPGSGKDEGALACQQRISNCHQKEFKEQLFRLTKTIYGLTDEQWERMYTRENKEKKYDSLGDKSPREAMIFVSENVIKPNFGKRYFGDIAAKNLFPGINVFSDGGFKEELDGIYEMIGPENMLIIRLHRKGCNFDNDSRSYIDEYKDVLIEDFYNDGDDIRDYQFDISHAIANHSLIKEAL